MEGDRPATLHILWPDGQQETHRTIPTSPLLRARPGQALAPLTPTPVQAPPSEAEAFTPRPWLLAPVPLADPALTSYRGQPLLFAFYASWCPPCRAELAALAQQQAAFAAAKLHVVVLQLDDGPAPATPFPVIRATEKLVGYYTLLYRALFDRKRDIQLPLSLLLDAQGRLLKLYQGPAEAKEILADHAAPNRPALPFPGLPLGPAPARTWGDLAADLAERGFAAEATEYFELALSQNQATYELLNNYAGLLVSRNDRAGAEKLLRQSLSLAPNQTASLENLALLLLETKPAEAQSLLEKALSLTPDLSRTRRALAGLYNDQGIAAMEANQAAGGRRAFEKALATDPTDPAAYLNLALFHAQQGDKPTALRLLNQLLAREPHHPAARQLLQQLQ
ncbi:MAG: hypothetical protein OHK0021_11560 [Bryobacter sp.]